MVVKITSSYPTTDILFISDKGMISKENIEFMEKKNYRYIVSSSTSKIYKKIETILKQKYTFTKLEDNLFYQKSEYGIICYNPQTAKKTSLHRKLIIDKCISIINKAKNDHPDTYKIFLAKHISKYYQRYFNDSYELKSEVIDKESLLDGTWMIKTNTKQTSTKSIIRIYKQQTSIEHAFDIIKNTLDIRPIYHYSDSRVKGHVFICILAYMVSRILELKADDSIHNILEKYKNTIALTINNKETIIGENKLLKQIS